MAEEVFIPKLGQTVEEVTIVSWLAADGEKVEAGQPIMDVETDKAVFPLEANANGYLHRGPFQEGQVVPVLTVVATIGKRDEVYQVRGAPSRAEEQPSPQDTVQVVAPAEQGAPEVEGTPAERTFASPRARMLAREKQVDLTQVPASGGGGVRVIERDVINFLSQRPRATPLAQKMASREGLDLTAVAGSGHKGAITKSDVQKALQGRAEGAVAGTTAVAGAVSIAAEAAASPELPTSPAVTGEDGVLKTVPLAGVRKIIFERMAASVHTSARVTLVSEVDATDLVQARQKLKESVSQAWGFAPGYNEILAMIVARALREFPYMNARVSKDGSAIEWLSRINLGIAVDTERGLLVPVIHDADQKRLQELGAALRQLAERARTGRSLPDELSGGTFTITNLGMYEIDAFTPVINLPEAAILGVGRITPKVVPYKDEVAVRQMLTLSLVFDHRLVDGAPAARFLQRIKQLVENPFLLLG